MSSDIAPVKLLKDVPSDLAEDDFAHSTYVEVLTESLQRAERPLTLGLFGPWGVGKSSILERLRASLSTEACAFVLFDAWRYDGETLRRHLLRETAHQLDEKDLLGPTFDPKKKLEELEVDRQSTRLRLDRSLVNLVPGLAAAVVAFLLVLLALQVPEINETLFGRAPQRTTLIASLTALIVLAANLMAQSLRMVPETTTRRRLEDPERFHDLFRDLVAALKPERLVLAIDNLDRCSAERVVELLGTIKTYLEPAVEAAAGEKHVLFIIAVDDDAVRRHLLAQEVSGGEQDVATASRNVDEYLRKVFNTSLRIAPLLHADLRSYLAARIEDARPGLALSETDEQELANLTHAALRSNPRRIIQFLNNLQIRLRLIRERERSRGDDEVPLIQPPISDAPLVVAKLALIEEEWPRHFAVLLDHPHLLAEWDERARAPEDAAWLDALDATLLAEWRTLAPFLRVTAGISAPNLRAVLRYKQSRDELVVPGYHDLRIAAVSGAREDVEAIMSAGEASRETYAEALVRILRDELEAEWLSGARSALEIGLAVSDPGDVPRRVLKTAVDVPAFRGELASVAAEPLFAAAEQLEPNDRPPVVDAALAGLEGSDPTHVVGFARVLAPRRSWMTFDQFSRLEAILASPEMTEQIRVIAQLTGADAAYMTPRLADAVADALIARPALLVGPARPDTMATVSVMFRRHHAPPLGQKLLGALSGVARSPEATEQTLEDAIDLAWEALWAPAPARAAFATDVLPLVRDSSDSRRQALAERLVEIAPPATEALDIVFEDPRAGVRWADAHLEALDPTARTAVADRAIAAATAADMTRSDREQAMAVAGRVDPEGHPARSVRAARELLKQGGGVQDITWLGGDAPLDFAQLLVNGVDELPAWKTVVPALDAAAALGLEHKAVVETLTAELRRFLDPFAAVDAIGFAHYLDDEAAVRAVVEVLDRHLGTELQTDDEREDFLLRMLGEARTHHSEPARATVRDLAIRHASASTPRLLEEIGDVSIE